MVWARLLLGVFAAFDTAQLNAIQWNTLDQQMQRLRRDKKRPLLQTENPRARLEALLAERRPIYLDLADLVIKTDRRVARRLAADIVNQLPENLK